MVAGPVRAALLASNSDLGSTGLDHEEADATLALLGDVVAGGEDALLEGAGDLLDLLGIEVAEERNALDQLCWGSGHGRILRRRRLVRKRGGVAGRARFLGALRELLDLPLRTVELLATEAVELLTALPEGDRLLERGLAALEPVDDLLELRLGCFEGQLLRHATRASNEPSATSTPISSPATTAVAE